MTSSEPARPPRPTLVTQRLVLRPFVLDDAPDVQRLAGDRRVAATTLNIPHPYEDGMAETWIGSHQTNWEETAQLTLAITTAADGLLGAVGLIPKLEHRRGEMGYWIAVPFWGQGYATEAARALMTYGFRELGLEKIEARHLAGNEASGRVMEKLGMRREGTVRRHIVKDGVVHDIVLYGILSSEWDPE